MKNNCNEPRLRKGDRPVIAMWPDALSYNELHSLALGGSIGLVLGERGLLLKTILREPWYFLAAFALSYALGRQIYR